MDASPTSSTSASDGPSPAPFRTVEKNERVVTETEVLKWAWSSARNLRSLMKGFHEKNGNCGGSEDRRDTIADQDAVMGYRLLLSACQAQHCKAPFHEWQGSGVFANCNVHRRPLCDGQVPAPRTPPQNEGTWLWTGSTWVRTGWWQRTCPWLPRSLRPRGGLCSEGLVDSLILWVWVWAGSC